MRVRKADLDSLRIRGEKITANLAAAVTSVKIDSKPGAVPQVTITALDPQGVLAKAGMNEDGTPVTWQGKPWVAVGFGLDLPAEGSNTQRFILRSPASVALRRVYRASVQRKVSIDSWARPRVEAAGYTFVGQPWSTKSTIAQSSGDKKQSELDVIAAGASSNDGTYMDRGEAFWLMTREWAFSQAPAGQQTWPVSYKRGKVSDLRTASFDSSPVDDTENFATASVTLEYDYGSRLQAWDLVDLGDVGGPWQGLWLIDGIGYTADLVSPISVPLVRPKPPTKKSGSKA